MAPAGTHRIAPFSNGSWTSLITATPSPLTLYKSWSLSWVSDPISSPGRRAIRTTWLLAAVNRTWRNELFSFAASLISMIRGSSMSASFVHIEDADAAHDGTESDIPARGRASPHTCVDFRPGAGSSRHFRLRRSQLAFR